MFFSFSRQWIADDVGQVVAQWCCLFHPNNNGSMWVCIWISIHHQQHQHRSFFWFRIFFRTWWSWRTEIILWTLCKQLQLLSVNRVHARILALLITNITATAFFYLADSVRKFFHSRVEMNAKNDVVKFQQVLCATSCDVSLLCPIQIYDEKINDHSEFFLCIIWSFGLSDFHFNWRQMALKVFLFNFQVAQWCVESEIETIADHILQLVSIESNIEFNSAGSLKVLKNPSQALSFSNAKRFSWLEKFWQKHLWERTLT